LNILIIGLGSIAKKHIRAIRELNIEVKIFALRSSLLSESFPGVHNISNLSEISEKIDFVLISNPTYLHKESIEETMKLNCPLFIEKPVFSDMNNVNEILNEVNLNNIITYVAFNLRFHPSIQFLKRFLDQNKPNINEINIYCGSYLPDWRPGIDFRKSYSSSTKMGGGVHLDLIHELDYCQWLFGEPLEISVLKRSVSTLNIEAFDYANYLLTYSSFTANIILNYFRKDAKRQIEIVMENKTLLIDLIINKITNITTGEILFNEKFNINETYEAQMQYFLSFLDKQQQPMNSISESVTVLKMALYE
jgi:predicted dehydrogenase